MNGVEKRYIEPFGNALVASRAFAAGDVVIRDRPMLATAENGELLDDIYAAHDRLGIRADLLGKDASIDFTLQLLQYCAASSEVRANVLQLFTPDAEFFKDEPYVRAARQYAAQLDDARRAMAQLSRGDAVGERAMEPIFSTHWDADEVVRVVLAWVCNSYSTRDGGGALYKIGSLVNHCCEGNTRYRFRDDDDGKVGEGGRGCGVFVAVRLILPGEVITTCYLGWDEQTMLSTRMRQKLLVKTKLFTCTCARCSSTRDPYRALPCPHCNTDCCPPSAAVPAVEAGGDAVKTSGSAPSTGGLQRCPELGSGPPAPTAAASGPGGGGGYGSGGGGGPGGGFVYWTGVRGGGAVAEAPRLVTSGADVPGESLAVAGQPSQSRSEPGAAEAQPRCCGAVQAEWAWECDTCGSRFGAAEMRRELRRRAAAAGVGPGCGPGGASGGSGVGTTIVGGSASRSRNNDGVGARVDGAGARANAIGGSGARSSSGGGGSGGSDSGDVSDGSDPELALEEEVQGVGDQLDWTDLAVSLGAVRQLGARCLAVLGQRHWTTNRCRYTVLELCTAALTATCGTASRTDASGAYYYAGGGSRGPPEGGPGSVGGGSFYSLGPAAAAAGGSAWGTGLGGGGGWYWRYGSSGGGGGGGRPGLPAAAAVAAAPPAASSTLNGVTPQLLSERGGSELVAADAPGGLACQGSAAEISPKAALPAAATATCIVAGSVETGAAAPAEAPVWRLTHGSAPGVTADAGANADVSAAAAGLGAEVAVLAPLDGVPTSAFDAEVAAESESESESAAGHVNPHLGHAALLQHTLHHQALHQQEMQQREQQLRRRRQQQRQEQRQEQQQEQQQQRGSSSPTEGTASPASPGTRPQTPGSQTHEPPPSAAANVSGPACEHAAAAEAPPAAAAEQPNAAPFTATAAADAADVAAMEGAGAGQPAVDAPPPGPPASLPPPAPPPQPGPSGPPYLPLSEAGAVRSVGGSTLWGLLEVDGLVGCMCEELQALWQWQQHHTPHEPAVVLKAVAGPAATALMDAVKDELCSCGPLSARALGLAEVVAARLAAAYEAAPFYDVSGEAHAEAVSVVQLAPLIRAALDLEGDEEGQEERGR